MISAYLLGCQGTPMHWATPNTVTRTSAEPPESMPASAERITKECTKRTLDVASGPLPLVLMLA